MPFPPAPPLPLPLLPPLPFLPPLPPALPNPMARASVDGTSRFPAIWFNCKRSEIAGGGGKDTDQAAAERKQRGCNNWKYTIPIATDLREFPKGPILGRGGFSNSRTQASHEAPFGPIIPLSLPNTAMALPYPIPGVRPPMGCAPPTEGRSGTRPATPGPEANRGYRPDPHAH